MSANNNWPQSIGFTAFWTAAVRAQESTRPDCLYNDPWAAALAGEEGAAWLAQNRGVAPLVLRTRYFDDWLRAVIQPADGPRQLVILASGLDTRAYRLEWPEGMRLFNLDLASVLRYKSQVLQNAGAIPRCEQIDLPVDLTGDWRGPLLDTGFDPFQPSAWLMEGFLFYIPNAAAAQILDTISLLSAKRSVIGFDIVNHDTLTSPYTKAWIEMQAAAGAPWLGCMDDPEQELAGRGWQAALSQPGAPEANHGRWSLPVYPVKMPDLPHNWYVTGKKV